MASKPSSMRFVLDYYRCSPFSCIEAIVGHNLYLYLQYSQYVASISSSSLPSSFTTNFGKHSASTNSKDIDSVSASCLADSFFL